jgi:hypothetical protein
VNLTFRRPFRDPGIHLQPRRLKLPRGLSRHQGLVHHLGLVDRHGSRHMEVDLDRLVRLRREAGVMENHMGLVAGHMELVADHTELVVGHRGVVVDMGLGSAPENDLRNFAEEGTGFDSHPVAVHSSAEEDIVVADRKELVGRIVVVVVVGTLGPGLRNSRCPT